VAADLAVRKQLLLLRLVLLLLDTVHGDVLAQQDCLQAHANDELVCQGLQHAAALLMQGKC
jgi:hypothetical protein